MLHKKYSRNSYNDLLSRLAAAANETFRTTEDTLLLLLLKQKGVTYREIGDALGVSKQAVDARVQRIKKLRGIKDAQP